MTAYEQRALKYFRDPADDSDTFVFVTFEDRSSLYLVRRAREATTTWEVQFSQFTPDYIIEWARASGETLRVVVLGEPVIGEFLRLAVPSPGQRSTRTLCTRGRVGGWVLNAANPAAS